MAPKTYLITGAESGLGKGTAFELARQEQLVIATVKEQTDVQALLDEAEKSNLRLQVMKLDITNAADREMAAAWDIDVLVNNAGISLGGAMLDIPEHALREQFETNVFGTILLTQVIGRQMVRKRSGKIVIVSSVHGIMADPFSGPYCGSKYALEAFGEAMSKELQEFNVQVQMINPGPYLTGFNDREYEAYKQWDDDPSRRLFDYEQLNFPYEQLDPSGCIDEIVEILLEEKNDFRNVIPKAMVAMAKKRQKDIWSRTSDEDLGQRHEMIEKSINIEAATTVKEGVIDRIKDVFD